MYRGKVNEMRGERQVWRSDIRSGVVLNSNLEEG